MTDGPGPGWSDLAIFGNAPAFAEPVHVGRPNIGDRERLLERLNDLLDRRWLSNNGRYEREFEARLSAMTGARHCIPLCNGTSALELAIKALGLTGEVIVPSFTFVATVHAVAFQGLDPVFADIDPVTHTIDPRSVERLITERTSAIIGVHLWGQPCDITALEQVANANGLKLLFDAAQAFGSSYQGQSIGNFGDLEVFSFHATKFINSFEGGAIATNDDALAQQLRLLANFGITGPEQVELVGSNRRMSEPAAAMGITSLESIDRFLAANRENFRAYEAALAGLRGVHLYPNDLAASNGQYVVIMIDADEAGIDRDSLASILQAENILARRYFHPGCHRLELYRAHATTPLPVTERVSDQILCLPTGTSVDAEDIARISAIIRTAVRHGREVTEALKQARSRRPPMQQ